MCKNVTRPATVTEAGASEASRVLYGLARGLRMDNAHRSISLVSRSYRTPAF